MMTKTMVVDESSKQTLGVHFNAIKAITVLKSEPSMEESWTENKHSYKVTLNVSMSLDSANAPIPYYGWQNGENVREVEMVKEGKIWKINSLATGP